METRSNHVLVGAVTLALLGALLIFIVWLAGLSNQATKCFDIYFSQGVGGLNKGSSVNFQGVPVGQIEKISLLPDRPEFVWVRVQVDAQTPILQGTTAQIKGVGFTGVSEIALEGAVKGARPLTQIGPQGCPVIPASSGGLGALLNSAPELIDRIQRLTERLTEMLSDRNQNAISDILENVEKTTDVLAQRAPDLADAIGDARIAARQAGIAAQRWGQVADSTNKLIQEEGQPAAEDLRRSIASVQSAADNLDAMIADARPGVQNLSKNTLPEVNRLVRDLRDLTSSLQSVSQRVEEGGVGGALGGGGKAPPWLLTLTPQAPAPANIARTAGPGQAVTIDTPVIPKEVRTNRVPVHEGPIAIAYVKDLTWVDTPDKLFQDLLVETVTRMTNLVVLDPNQSTLDPGTTVSGNLSRFGYDVQEGVVIVRYDATMQRSGGTGVVTRRFEARESADGTASTVAPAINAAANRVAMEVAQWVGGG